MKGMSQLDISIRRNLFMKAVANASISFLIEEAREKNPGGRVGILIADCTSEPGRSVVKAVADGTTWPLEMRREARAHLAGSHTMNLSVPAELLMELCRTSGEEDQASRIAATIAKSPILVPVLVLARNGSMTASLAMGPKDEEDSAAYGEEMARLANGGPISLFAVKGPEGCNNLGDYNRHMRKERAKRFNRGDMN